MKIAVNTRLLLPDKMEGIGVFTVGILKALTRKHPEHEFIFIFDRPFHTEFVFSDNITPMVVCPPTRHPILLHIWLEYRLPGVFKKTKTDVFLSPDGFLSLSSKVPSVAIMHDLSFYHRPDDIPAFPRWHYNHFFPRYAEKARRIVTVSNFSKNDIKSTWHQGNGKIKVVGVGADERFRPSTRIRIAATRRSLTSGAPYFLYAGSLHPRKNIPNLMKAFDLFKADSNLDTRLVIVGRKMFKTGDIFKTYNRLRYRDDVIFTGYVDPDRLVDIYGAALALVYVSFFEGFGIPLAEAMNCEIPIITSNTTAMPETSGDAALKVDPRDIRDIARAMKDIAMKPDLRNELVTAGKNQRKKFSLEKASETIWNCIQEAWKSKNG